MDKAASPCQLYVLTNKLLVRAATSGVVKHEITRVTNEHDPARGKGWQLCPGFSLPARCANDALAMNDKPSEHLRNEQAARAVTTIGYAACLQMPPAMPSGLIAPKGRCSVWTHARRA